VFSSDVFRGERLAAEESRDVCGFAFVCENPTISFIFCSRREFLVLGVLSFSATVYRRASAALFAYKFYTWASQGKFQYNQQMFLLFCIVDGKWC